MHHIPLVLFTVFVQAATGLLLFQGMHTLLKEKNNNDDVIAKIDYPLISMWVLFLFAILASFVHIGKPANILNIFNGLSSGSPLSMEVMSVFVFGLTVFLYTACIQFKKNKSCTRFFLGISMIAALVQSYAVASVYMIVTIPLWDSLWTYTQFFMSAIALGCTSMLIFIYSNSNHKNKHQYLMRWNSLGIIILLVLIIISAAFSTFVINIPFEGEPLLVFLPCLRIALLVFAFMLLTFMSTQHLRPALIKYLSIFLCVLGSELVGRIFFYDLQQVSGMLQIFSY